MDVRREDHQAETPLDAPAALASPAPVDVPGHGAGDGSAPDRESRLRKLIQLRDTVRVELHRQLDDLLALPGQGTVTVVGGSILDAIVVDVMNGLGFQVTVQTRNPNEEGRAVEDPSVTAASMQQKPLIEIVR